jgi:hypothetical protein
VLWISFLSHHGFRNDLELTLNTLILAVYLACWSYPSNPDAFVIHYGPRSDYTWKRKRVKGTLRCYQVGNDRYYRVQAEKAGQLSPIIIWDKNKPVKPGYAK